MSQGMMPTRKVTAGALGGSLAAILAWILHEAVGLQMPPGIEAAVATVVGFLLSYYVPEAQEASRDSETR